MAFTVTITGGSNKLHPVYSTYAGSVSGGSFTPTKLLLGTHNVAVVTGGAFSYTVTHDFLGAGQVFSVADNGANIEAIDTVDIEYLPISERIILNIESTLAAITVGADYANTVASVDRPNPGLGQARVDRALLLTQNNPSLAGSHPQGKYRWIHPFEIDCDVAESGSTTSIDTRLNTLRADVEKALMVDVTRGGLANNTELADPDFEPTEANARQGSVKVTFNVTYDVLRNDPYHQ